MSRPNLYDALMAPAAALIRPLTYRGRIQGPVEYSLIGIDNISIPLQPPMAPSVIANQAKDMQVLDNLSEVFISGPYDESYDSHKKCIACITNKVDYISIPCGHFTYCGDCQLKIQNNKCPLCNCEKIKYQRIRWT